MWCCSQPRAPVALVSHPAPRRRACRFSSKPSSVFVVVVVVAVVSPAPVLAASTRTLPAGPSSSQRDAGTGTIMGRSGRDLDGDRDRDQHRATGPRAGTPPGGPSALVEPVSVARSGSALGVEEDRGSGSTGPRSVTSTGTRSGAGGPAVRSSSSRQASNLELSTTPAGTKSAWLDHDVPLDRAHTAVSAMS